MPRANSFRLPSWLPSALLVLGGLYFLYRVARPVLRLFGLGESSKQLAQRKAGEVAAIAATVGLSPDRLLADARAIAHHLGTAYPPFHFLSWTEDEVSAIRVVRTHTLGTIPGLNDAYRVETDGRSLRADLQQYLSPVQWHNLQDLYPS